MQHIKNPIVVFALIYLSCTSLMCYLQTTILGLSWIKWSYHRWKIISPFFIDLHCNRL